MNINYIHRFVGECVKSKENSDKILLFYLLLEQNEKQSI